MDKRRLLRSSYKIILKAFLIRNLHLYGWRGVERGVENSVAGQTNGGR